MSSTHRSGGFSFAGWNEPTGVAKQHEPQASFVGEVAELATMRQAGFL